MSNRRIFLQRFLGLSAGFVAARGLSAQEMQMPMGSETYPKSSPSKRIPTSPVRNLPVVTTDIGDLPYTMDGNTKVFHLIAEVVKQKISPMKTHRSLGLQRLRAGADDSGQSRGPCSRDLRQSAAGTDLDALAWI